MEGTRAGYYGDHGRLARRYIDEALRRACLPRHVRRRVRADLLGDIEAAIAGGDAFEAVRARLGDPDELAAALYEAHATAGELGRPFREYRSAATLFGLPLVHIVRGPGRHAGAWPGFVGAGAGAYAMGAHGASTPLPPVAHGVIAIGIRARGVVAIGNLACGGIAIGNLSAGIVSIGNLSAGVLTLANMGVGALVALGNMAAGALAAGNMAIGAAAVGNLAVGRYAVGNVAAGAHALEVAGGDTFGALLAMFAGDAGVPEVVRSFFAWARGAIGWGVGMLEAAWPLAVLVGGLALLGVGCGWYVHRRTRDAWVDRDRERE